MLRIIVSHRGRQRLSAVYASLVINVDAADCSIMQQWCSDRRDVPAMPAVQQSTSTQQAWCAPWLTQVSETATELSPCQLPFSANVWARSRVPSMPEDHGTGRHPAAAVTLSSLVRRAHSSAGAAHDTEASPPGEPAQPSEPVRSEQHPEKEPQQPSDSESKIQDGWALCVCLPYWRHKPYSWLQLWQAHKSLVHTV